MASARVERSLTLLSFRVEVPSAILWTEETSLAGLPLRARTPGERVEVGTEEVDMDVADVESLDPATEGKGAMLAEDAEPRLELWKDGVPDTSAPADGGRPCDCRLEAWVD